MSSIMSSQGVVLAMAAFSGTVILLALKQLQKTSLSPSSDQFQVNPIRVLRPCLSSGERKGDKKKKRVRFAEDVVDPTGDSEVFRRQHGNNSRKSGGNSGTTVVSQSRGMPANRAALYNGILKDRVIHRMTCSY